PGRLPRLQGCRPAALDVRRARRGGGRGRRRDAARRRRRPGGAPAPTPRGRLRRRTVTRVARPRGRGGRLPLAPLAPGRPPAQLQATGRGEMERGTIVTGVIGADTHIVGNRIISLALEADGFRVISLGALTPAEEFIKAAVETAADAILVSSLYGHGELD